jgi:hypothetical protein
MDTNVIDFPARLPQPVARPEPDQHQVVLDQHQVVLDLEHEVSELRHAISVLYVELMRQRCG